MTKLGCYRKHRTTPDGPTCTASGQQIRELLTDNLPESLLAGTVTAVEAALLLGSTCQTLATWRHRKTGPTYLRVGNSIRYRLTDLEAFIQVVPPKEQIEEVVHETNDTDLWTTKQAAEFLGVDQVLLRKQRTRGIGPNYLRIGLTGKKIRYRKEHLEWYKQMKESNND